MWDWPVGPPHAIVRPYAAPATVYGPGHRGVDLAAGAGAVVGAPADGVVHFAGFVVDRPLLSIEHGDRAALEAMLERAARTRRHWGEAAANVAPARA